MKTIVGIFIFIRKENFMLSQGEHEKSFINWGMTTYFDDWDSYFSVKFSKIALWHSYFLEKMALELLFSIC